MRKRKLRKAAAVILALSMMFPAQAIAAGGGADVTEEITEQGDDVSDIKKEPEIESEEEASGDKEEILKDETETVTEEEKTEGEKEEPETSEVTENGEEPDSEETETEVKDEETDEEEKNKDDASEQVNIESGENESDSDEVNISTDSDATRESYNVTYIVSPEELSDKAEVEGDSEVENGKTLKLKVTPEEGYEVEVTANGDILEGHRGMLGLADYYNYRVEDVKDDLEIEITVTGEATEGFFYEESKNGVTVTLSAEAGVLPERTTAEIEAVELGTENGISEEELSKYDTVYAFDIKLYDAEGEILPNDWSENGSVKVEFSGEKIKEQAEKSEAADIIHIDSETEEVEIEEKKAEDEIVYEAEHFSVIAVGYVNEVTENVLYVSAKGDDKSGDGSIDNPYATLAGAVNSFDENETDYTIYVMSNIDATSSARFWGKNVTITSYEDEVYTITRQEGFSRTIDAGRGGYNGAILEVQSGSELILKNIILDDAHEREAELFEEQVTGAGDKGNENRVQSAIIEASGDGGGTIILDEGSVLKNFGGMSAVRIGGQFNAEGTYSSLIMKEGSKIIDDSAGEERAGGFAAVWNQGGYFEMENGSEISGLTGRAVFLENGGHALINGNIGDITPTINMKDTDGIRANNSNGVPGIAIVAKENSYATLGETGTIKSITGNHLGDEVISLSGSSFTMEYGSVISDIGISCLMYSNGARSYINGRIENCNSDNVLFRIRGGEGSFDLQEKGIITESTTTDFGIFYVQGRQTITIAGEISNTDSREDEAVVYMASNEFPGSSCIVKDTAKLINNGQNVFKIRNDTEFIMEGGEIKDNKLLAIDYRSQSNYSTKVDLLGGEILGNNGGKEQIVFEASGDAGSATNEYRYMQISENLTIAENKVLNTTLGNIALENGFENIKLGRTLNSTKTELSSTVKSVEGNQGWSDAMTDGLWLMPSGDNLHFTMEKPSNAQETGLYVAYIELDNDGAIAENASPKIQYVENKNILDIELSGLNAGRAYALLLFNSDRYIISPRDTTIYTGGTNSEGDSTGFHSPEFIGIPEGATIYIDNEVWNVEANGYPFEVEYRKFNTNGTVSNESIQNDREEGEYAGIIIPANGITEEELYGMQISEEGSNEKKGVIFADGLLIIRYVSDADAAVSGEMTNILFSDQESAHAAIADSKKAVATVEGASTFYINGEFDRNIETDSTGGISLLDDEILTDEQLGEGISREKLLLDKAVAELANQGIIDGIEMEDLNYDFHYLDLVDTNNGNVWVSSSAGTDVHMPYPDNTDSNTEFYLLHYRDLHREYGINGEAEVQNAINASEVEILQNTENKDTGFVTGENGVIFHVDEANFSPYVLVWVDDTPSTTPETPDDDDDGHHSPGGGGGSSSGGSYTAGINGNWVHVGPVDINVPLSTNVPEGATPVTNPEWHQWKFILNNGTMIFNQWAYIRNPYAVNGQPSEGWFSFDENGIMNYGWYLDVNTGNWYYLHRESDGMLGTMETGWHYDGQDGRWYYLDPDGGEMLLGWQQIGGSWYYFNPMAPAVTWNYDEATGGWTYNGSDSRPYGSMYINETTPDGYTVDENGAWRN